MKIAIYGRVSKSDKSQDPQNQITPRALPVFPGMPFVLRGMSPKELLGGGSVRSAAAGTVAGDGLAPDDEDSPELAALLAALRAAGLPGATPAEAGALANLREERALELCEQLAGDGRAARVRKPAGYVESSLAAELLERVRERLQERERETPWIAGITSLTLARELRVPELALVRLLAVAVDEGELVQNRGYYATPEFEPQLTGEQLVFFERAFAGDAAQPLRPLPFAELAARARGAGIAGLAQAFETLLARGTLVKVDDQVYRSAQIAEVRARLPPLRPLPFAELAARARGAGIAGLAQAFETLLARGTLVKVDDQVYRSAQIAEVRARLESALRREGAIAPAAFRDLVGTTRKYAVPLLEWFDAAGVTLRNGDLRVLREKRSAD